MPRRALGNYHDVLETGGEKMGDIGLSNGRWAGVKECDTVARVGARSTYMIKARWSQVLAGKRLAVYDWSLADCFRYGSCVEAADVD